MIRGGNIVKAIGSDVTLFYATFVGGGDASNLTVPANSVVPKTTNLALTGTRTGEGVYSCVLADGTPQVVSVIPVSPAAPAPGPGPFARAAASTFSTDSTTVPMLSSLTR